MTASEAMRLAASRGLRFEMNDEGLVVRGDRDTLDELYDLLRPHRLEIRALLEEHVVPAAAGDPTSAASLLRHGLWPPTNPSDCNFHIGAPGRDCRRCGATWHFHVEKAAGRIAPPRAAKSRQEPRMKRK